MDFGCNLRISLRNKHNLLSQFLKNVLYNAMSSTNTSAILRERQKIYRKL